MNLQTKPDVVGRLVGADCEWCDDGTLERGTYKANDAAVCDDCSTPAVQLW